MNKKIFFDLHTVDSDIFVDKFSSIVFDFGVLYSVDILIVPEKDVKDNLEKRFPSRKNSDDQSLFLIKTIPFVIHSMYNRRERLLSLFLDIFVSVSYTDVDSYEVDGEFYNKAFCIEIDRSGLIR